MNRILVFACLTLLAVPSFGDSGVRGVVHLSSYQDGTTRFVYIDGERLLVADYRHDPHEAFWKEIPEWTDRTLTTEEIDEFLSAASRIVSDWESNYNGLEGGEKICRDLAWGVKIESAQLTFDSLGICKEPANFPDLVAELTALISGDDSD